ncbi:TetR family transcriptional regulator [Lactococcus hircilactis]|uniref:TetR family transcriptional regulator n=1 Tax=Lactococcus hircilactis TaxID=1494462 RepID=A0A7X1Z8S6_9LACT|nr:TetR/AcrR family transcriptional regulator [Lactococcus hircilactis]MQW39913.1 TetR family transcriptional regulator [Lactococcus hircilactis]
MATDPRKDRTKSSLRDAMITLLQKKTFDQISTTELVKTAGVSRSGFYTHYQDKYDMIEAYQRMLFNTIQYVFEKNNGNLRETLLETYQFLNKNEIYAALLSENGSKEIHQFILQKLKDLLELSIFPQNPRHHEVGKLGKVYATTYFANAIFGVTQAWIRRNKKETPAQITELLINLIN